MTKVRFYSSISIQKLADAINGEVRTIRLPAFQRDAVWDEAHVELLWDSIIRGYPVGTLLFARAENLDLEPIR